MKSLNALWSLHFRLTCTKRFSPLILFLAPVFLHAQTCNPSVSIATSAASICIGQSASYTVSGAISYTLVSNPVSSPAFNGTTGVISPTTNTSYQVIGTNQSGCISSTQKILFVNQLPSISVSASPTLVCVGFPSTLTTFAAPTSTAHQYFWAHGDSSATTVVNPLYTKDYTVTGTNTITSCENTKTISVTVFNPMFVSTHDTAICRGYTIALTASGAAGFTWTGGPVPGFGTVYVVSPSVATVYTVEVNSVNTNGVLKCKGARTISVGIYLQPTVTAVASRTAICKWEPVDIIANGGHTYYWPLLNQTNATITVVPLTDTYYHVVGTDIYGCTDTGGVKIKVYLCHDPVSELPEIKNDSFRIFPNPADKFFEIEVPGSMEIGLCNIDGNLVKQTRAYVPGSVSILTEDLSSGVYILTGWYEGKLIRQKVVIQR